MSDAEGGTSVDAAIRLPADQEDRCRRYAAARFVFNLAELTILPAVLVGLTLTHAAHEILTLAQVPGAPAWLDHLLYLVALGLIARFCLLPFQYLGEHWLDLRFGLTRQRSADWLWEWLCRSTVVGLATVLVLFAVVETLRWPWVALVCCLLFILARPLFFDHVYYPLLASFYPVSFLRHETFSLPGVGKRTLPVFMVKVSHRTPRANAAIRLHARSPAIYVTDTLIEEFTDGEERVVMAHEFGHLYDRLHLEERTRAGVAQAHRKLMLGTAQVFAGIVSVGIVHLCGPTMGVSGALDLCALPLVAAMTLVLAQVAAPYACREARRDECDADEYALAVTGDVENYLSVMRKLRALNLDASGSSPLARFLFDTHPSYLERVRLARDYRRRYGNRRKSPTFRGWRHVQRHGRR